MLPWSTFPPTIATLSTGPKPDSLSRSSTSPLQALEVIALANTEDSFIDSSTPRLHLEKDSTCPQYYLFSRDWNPRHNISLCPNACVTRDNQIQYKPREQPNCYLVLCKDKLGYEPCITLGDSCVPICVSAGALEAYLWRVARKCF